MTTLMELRDVALAELTLDEWQVYVARHPNSTVFHHRAWLELLSEQYGLRIHLYGVKSEGKIIAGVPFLEVRRTFAEPKLSCLPFTDCVGPLADDEASQEGLSAALSAAELSGHSRVVLKTDQPLVNNVQATNIVRHELDLTVGADRVRAGISATAKRNKRRAERQGLEFAIRCDERSVDDFYALHLETRRRLGVPIQPKRFFDRLYKKIVVAGLGSVATVLEQGVPVAAVIALRFNSTMVYKYAASRTSARELRPNDLLVWNLIDLAIRDGYQALDFGTSQLEEVGLRRFKSKWGAVETPVALDFIRGTPGAQASGSKLMPVVSAVIRRSPPAVCRILGELLYRYTA